MNLAVACGVAVGTAVFSGALLVGDSLRGSLRSLTLDRLGSDRLSARRRPLLPRQAGRRIGRQAGFPAAAAAVPLILLPANLETADPATPARANQVNLIGSDRRFWDLGAGRPGHLPGRREIVLNRPLAERLGVASAMP